MLRIKRMAEACVLLSLLPRFWAGLLAAESAQNSCVCFKRHGFIL